jgi:hypothetical protein
MSRKAKQVPRSHPRYTGLELPQTYAKARILSQVRGSAKGFIVFQMKNIRKLHPPAKAAVKLLQPTWHCNPHRVAGRSVLIQNG